MKPDRWAALGLARPAHHGRLPCLDTADLLAYAVTAGELDDPILAMLYAIEAELGVLAAVLSEDMVVHRYSAMAENLYRRVKVARCLLEKADGGEPVVEEGRCDGSAC